jgi:hypothetical protein
MLGLLIRLSGGVKQSVIGSRLPSIRAVPGGAEIKFYQVRAARPELGRTSGRRSPDVGGHLRRRRKGARDAACWLIPHGKSATIARLLAAIAYAHRLAGHETPTAACAGEIGRLLEYFGPETKISSLAESADPARLCRGGGPRAVHRTAP